MEFGKQDPQEQANQELDRQIGALFIRSVIMAARMMDADVEKVAEIISTPDKSREFHKKVVEEMQENEMPDELKKAVEEVNEEEEEEE